MIKNLSIIQRLTRLYTFYSPIRKGKNRIALASLKLEGKLPEKVLVKTQDGRNLIINFDNHFAYFSYFLGEYEAAITNVCKKIIKKGNVCLDVGANAGWFTTLFQTLVGNIGQVHSFEPVPPTFEVLSQNVEINKNSEIVRLNNLALGDTRRQVKLHIPKNKADGHASISNFGNSETEIFSAEMITLDSYLEQKKIDQVDFVKADIEGAELSMLEGATRLFNQDKPPIMEIEMALDTTKGFGYLPNDLIEFIRKQCDYEFYSIDEKTFHLKKIEGFAENDKGANVLCVPVNLYQEKLQQLNIQN